MKLTFEEAMELLRYAHRDELHDLASGDRKIYWWKDGQVIAEGYCGSSVPTVYINDEVAFNGFYAAVLISTGGIHHEIL